MSLHGAARHVLLIDDSHEDCFLTKQLLVRAGVKAPIVTIHSGERAWRVLRAAGAAEHGTSRPGIIFCDVRMPACDGLELLEKVRTEGVLQDVPFYMLSGGSMDAEKTRARALGAVGFLEKFPTPEEFRPILAAAGLV